MKAIMMSIRPQWIEKILNKEKTIEVRKCFPANYVGWVYIYCTKGQGLVFDSEGKGLVNSKLFPYAKNCPEHNRLVNGKVVARFWCDKVEEINVYGEVVTHFSTENIKEDELLKKSCLSYGEMFSYFDNYENGYAIHITKLKIFNKPKELSEFKRCQLLWCCEPHDCEECRHALPLTRAPQSYCFIEI